MLTLLKQHAFKLAGGVDGASPLVCQPLLRKSMHEMLIPVCAGGIKRQQRVEEKEKAGKG